MKKLCLNMIVKNERANLGRCLASLADHIDCWVIGDTGSDDGTPDFIQSFFARRGIRGELHRFPFHNFEQARNTALECAYASNLAFDYLLFCDADMELVVENPEFRSTLTAVSYQVLQRAQAGGLVYWNTRLAHRSAQARYRGVTHEYLEIGGDSEKLRGVWYKDHATGANRVDKFERDIRLLADALQNEPNSARYWFYLAQSYRDAGSAGEAAAAYAKRIEMGGWDEEVWYSRWQRAQCLRTLGDDAGFLQAALAAFNARPWRAEPLYDLARYFRERGMHDASLLFSEAGLAIGLPDDVLFVEGSIYTVGLKEEYATAAFYSPDAARRERGHALCDWLALSPAVPKPSRDLARSNLFYYTEAASVLMPSLEIEPGVSAAFDSRVLKLGQATIPVAADTFDETAQAVELGGGSLALIREADKRNSQSNSWHRLAWFDAGNTLRRISRRFYFSSKGSERVVGLPWRSSCLLIGYFGEDGVARTALVKGEEVAEMLADVAAQFG